MADDWRDEVARQLGYGKPEKKSTFDPANATPLNPKPSLSDPRTKGWADGVLAEAVERIVTAAPGTRNGTLNSEAWSLYHKLGQFYGDDALTDALLGACARNGLLQEDGEKQCRDTINSGFKNSVKDHGGTWYQNVPRSEINVEYVVDMPLSSNGTGPPEPPRTDSYESIFELENGFWDSRESLQHIYTASMSRMCAPWAVLANVTARVLTTVRPNTVLPSLVGGKGSLNWFAAVSARSGGGKGSASACAADLIKEDVYVRNLGSGEGICQQFYKPGNSKVPPTVHEAIMFEATEIDTMSALADRQGQTTMGVLRAGFSGETIGFSYRNNDHHIDAHSYRMTLVLSLQPGRARPLLADEAGGTPQRFQWFPGTDSRVSADRPWWPGELEVPSFNEWLYPRELRVPQVVEDTIVNERVKAQRGDQHALDGHALFVREKFAFALALLDNRVEMTEEDWELSGIASEISTRTRRWVVQELEHVTDVEAERRGRQFGLQAATSDASRKAFSARREWEIEQKVVEKLAEKGPLKNRDLRNNFHSDDRTWLPKALQNLVDRELISRNRDNEWTLLT